MDWVLVHASNGALTDNRNVLFAVALCLLTVIYTFESMKTLSYISITAMCLLCCSLFIVMWSATSNLVDAKFDKHIKVSEPSGLIYFFGTIIFAFEGNPVILEVRHQSKDKKKFKLNVVYGSAIVLTLYLALGMICYVSFAQFTKPFILANMEPNSLNFFV